MGTPLSDELCEELSWDSEWWGFPVARMDASLLDPDCLGSVDDWCLQHGIRLLYLLCPSERMADAQLAEGAGFRLMDVRVTLRNRSVGSSDQARPSDEGVRVRLADGDDALALGEMAAHSHGSTRFYADPGLPDARCDDLYRVWMEQECEGHADAVFAAEHRGELAGYLSCAVDDIAHRGTIGLVGVSESHRRLGIGSLLLTEALSWFHEQGVPVVSVVTQGRNTSALRLYQRHGFEIDEVGLWFHKWYPAATET
jgi:dTDP-4-amino-4,6-dideoxy-D-galactose acyltransferase